MEQLIEKVMQATIKAGLVQIEISARHIHVSKESRSVLFGEDAVLHPKRPLSQKGQYLSEERVTLIGPKGRMERVAVLGPERSATQVELSGSDCRVLGIDAPLRQSGDLGGATGIRIEGPNASEDAKSVAIIAHCHIHMPPDVAEILKLHDNEKVDVKVLSDRPLTFNDVIIRIHESFRFRMHVDFDEANAAGISGFTLGQIIRKEE